MKKKFAYLLLGPQFDPAAHIARFETAHSVSCIYTVRNYEEARARAKICTEEGFGVIELCGAFGPERAKELIELTDGKVAVGYVTHFAEQDGLFTAFFQNQSRQDRSKA